MRHGHLFGFNLWRSQPTCGVGLCRECKKRAMAVSTSHLQKASSCAVKPTGHGSRRHVARHAAADDGAPSKPTRGVLILPGLGNNAADYTDLSEKLRSKGYAVATAPISRLDWSRNAMALTDGAWWRGCLKPRPAVDWYLTRLNTAMQALKQEVDEAPITILTHSAGGWLGRVYMHEFGAQGVDRFVSLGSPHLAPPKGVVDQTRGILTWVNDTVPGAFHNHIAYTTVAGRYIQGVPLNGEGTALAKFAGAGYQQVCGDPSVWGDFIVPLPAAHLEGACNLDLDGVFHSPLGEKQLGPWYGSDNVLSLWEWALDGSTPVTTTPSSTATTSQDLEATPAPSTVTAAASLPLDK